MKTVEVAVIWVSVIVPVATCEQAADSTDPGQFATDAGVGNAARFARSGLAATREDTTEAGRTT